MSLDSLDLPRGGGLDHRRWVYIHRAADGSALYIGSCQKPRERTRAHATGAEWWPQVVDVEIDGPYDDLEGRDVEARLIREHQPPHNILHTDRYVHPRHRAPDAVERAEREVAEARKALRRAECKLAQVRRGAAQLAKGGQS